MKILYLLSETGYEGATMSFLLLKYASALLVASPSEGLGRMTAEAAFAGCMVIGYNAAGTKYN